ncbi:MAG: hypothetical protein JXJ17_17075 [Anaerolineae bacterium]|nr:hypothetical protein [Anaerolineae bacterium]
MNYHKPQLYLVDDPVAETMALLQSQPFPFMVLILLAALRQAEVERDLSPAARIAFLMTVQHILVKAAHRAA